MNILVFNCGSSSLNFKLYAVPAEGAFTLILAGKAHRVGVRGSEPAFIEFKQAGQVERQVVEIPDHRRAAGLALDYLQAQAFPIDQVGHRIVHGGSEFSASVWINAETLRRFEACLPLSPVHNPNAMSVIQTSLERLPAAAQYLSFDTAFHAHLDPAACSYAIPADLARAHQLRRYGFHGLSYQYVTQEAARLLSRPAQVLRLVACHLGTGGSSVAAIRNGHSVDTSMGFTPVAGVMMSTRTGDLDPLLPLYLMRTRNLSAAQVSDMLFKQSGLLGISGFSSDIRDLLRVMDESTGADSDLPAARQAALAFKMYCYTVQRTLGAYMTLLGGADAILFTDDIGVQNPRVRSQICQGMEWCGVFLDAEVNACASPASPVRVSTPASPVQVWSLPTDEELVIAREGLHLWKEQTAERI